MRLSSGAAFGLSGFGAIASHNGMLYGVRKSDDALYVIDIGADMITKVGTAIQFGVGEGSPEGLASHNGRLYMVGRTNDALYVLDTTTGVATRVGNAIQFEVGEGIPTALASHDGRLLMVGLDTDALHVLGVPDITRAVSAPNLDVTNVGTIRTGETVRLTATPSGGVYDTISYAWSIRSGGGSLDRMDGPTVVYTPEPGVSSASVRIRCVATIRGTGLFAQTGTSATVQVEESFMVSSISIPSTGIATKVGTATNFGITEGQLLPGGLTSHNDQLYMVGALRATGGVVNRALYTIDSATGIATRVGTAANFGVSENAPTGLASHGGRLYMVGRSNHILYTIDPATGIATRVGTATDFGISGIDLQGLASHGGKLYAAEFHTVFDSITFTSTYFGALYTINVATGVATKVGSALRYGASLIDANALASHGGSLYMTGSFASFQDALYTVDATTGIATRVGTATNFGVNEINPLGLASQGGSLYMVGATTRALHTLA